MLFKEEGIILRSLEYSDTSQILTVLTPEHGKVGIMAKGVRRRKNPYQGCIDVPNHLELVYYRKSNDQLGILREVSLITHFPQIRQDLEKSFAAMYCIEMIRKASLENDVNEKLFYLLRYGLYKLNTLGLGGKLTNLLLYVQWYTLQFLGFQPQIFSCSRCGREWDASMSRVAFISSKASTFCIFCLPRGYSYLLTSGSALQKLQSLIAKSREGSLDSLEFSLDESKSLYEILAVYFQSTTEETLEMSRYFTKKV